MSALRIAVRSAVRSPVLTAALVATMTVGLALSVVAFSLADALLLRPLAVTHPDQLIIVEQRDVRTGESDNLPISEVAYLRARSRATTGLVGYDYTRLNAVDHGVAEMVDGRLVGGDLFALLGVKVSGRPLTSADDRPGATPVALVNCAFAARRLPTGAIGHTITLNGLAVTIVGVLPCDFAGLAVGEVSEGIWLPMALHPELALHDHVTVGAVGRLAPGVDIRTAELELDTLHRSYRREVAASHAPDRDASRATDPAAWRISVTSGAHGIGDLGVTMRTPLTLLNVAALVVLLIVCINVANLLLVRFTARRGELAVRRALGASRGSIAGQLLAEVSVYAITAGAAAVMLVPLVARAVVRHLTPPGTSLAVSLALRPDVLAFSVLAIVVVIAFAGIAPTMAAARSSAPDLIAASPRTVGDRGALRLGRLHVIAQMALSLILLVLAGQLWRGIGHLTAMDPGFSTAHVLEFSLYPGALGYAGADELRLYDGTRSQLAMLPGIESVGLSRYPVVVETRTPCTTFDRGTISDVAPRPVSPGFFRTVGMPILRGRDFAISDGPAAPPVVVLSRFAADSYFPGADPVGRTLRIGTDSAHVETRQIVGVAGDLRSFGPRPEDVGSPTCAAFIPFAQAAASDRGQAAFLVRSSSGMAATYSAIRRAVGAIDPNLSIMFLQPLQTDVGTTISPRTSAASLARAFAGLALLLSCIGVYGVLSYAVSRRTNEIGVRLALGALPMVVRSMVVADALRPVLAGVALGAATAGLLLPLAAHSLYGLQVVDPAVVAVSVALLLIVGIAAAWIPARRAARVDPVCALRAS
jgi:predicted permease